MFLSSLYKASADALAIRRALANRQLSGAAVEWLSQDWLRFRVGEG